MRAKLKIQQMNGITAEEPLEDAVVFTGNNGAGKSTRLNALLLALLGYIPDGPRKSSDIMAFATDRIMKVSFEGPFLRIDREFVGTTSSAKTNIDVGPDDGDFKNSKATDKEKNARILDELGGEPFALDLGAFTGMNQNQQRAFILDICAEETGEDPFEKIYCHLADNKTDPEHPALQPLFTAIPSRGAPEEKTLAGVLSNTVAILRSLKSSHESDIRNAEGTARDMSKARKDLNTSAALIRETKDEIAKVQKELEEVAGEKGKTETAGEAHESMAAQIQTVEQNIKLKKQSLGAGTPLDVKKAEDRHQALVKRKGNVAKAIILTEERIEELGKDLDAKLAEINTHKEERAVRASQIANAQRRADLLQEGKCPLGLECPHPPKAFEDTQAKQIATIGYMSKRLKQTDESWEFATKEWNTLKGEEAKVRGSLKKSHEELQQLDIEIPTALRDIEIIKEIETLNGQLQTLKAKADQGQVIVADDVLQAKEQGLRARLEELNQLLEDKEIQKANEIAFARALEDKERLNDWLKVVKQALDLLGPKGLQTEAAKAAAGPFLAAVNLTLRQFGLKAYVETERNGKPVFEMGLEHSLHGNRPWTVLPKSYRAIMGCAIALAFFALRGSKKAILAIDDLEHLDQRNRTRFLEVIRNKIKDGSLDLLVGASTEVSGIPTEMNVQLKAKPPEEMPAKVEEPEPKSEDAANGQGDLFDRAAKAHEKLKEMRENLAGQH